MIDCFIKIILAYLLGSVSGSLLLGRLRGVDIRTQGSGNAGGTNALRTQGVVFALAVIVIDIGKGVLATGWLPGLHLPGLEGRDAIATEVTAVACGLAAIIGHMVPIYFGFRGGKGAATAVGAVGTMIPIAIAPTVAVWVADDRRLPGHGSHRLVVRAGHPGPAPGRFRGARRWTDRVRPSRQRGQSARWHRAPLREGALDPLAEADLTPTRRQILDLLTTEDFVSGEALGEALGISRAAVWKHLRALERGGVAVERAHSRGYRLRRVPDVLDAERIGEGLTGTGSTWQVEVLEEIDSTNSELLRRSRSADVHRQVLIAEHQSGGRGRRGRPWDDQPGQGLCLSLAWRNDAPVDRLQGLSLALGAAAVAALERLGIEGLGLKWPNDLILDGRKLGGILIEVRGEFDGPCLVVAGIGLNVHAGADAADRADLSQRGLDRNALAGHIVSAWAACLDDFDHEGFGPWRAQVERLDVLAGRPVRLDAADGAIEGTACGIDGEGGLRVDTSEGLRVITGGEWSTRVPSMTASWRRWRTGNWRAYSAPPWPPSRWSSSSPISSIASTESGRPG